MDKIIVHQAFYGEVNKAHSCISQTLNDPDSKSFLTSFTDRPAALPVGEELLPYYSGCSYSNYYFFSKTFSDKAATRSGMVFSHVLIISISDIVKINNLDDIFDYFIKTIPVNVSEFGKFEINTDSLKDAVKEKLQPHFLQQTISSYISEVKPIIFSGEENSFKKVLQILWNDPDTYKRKDLKFRASFTPSDLETDKDLSIVIVQENFLSKWQGWQIISDKDNIISEIESPTELLFLGFKEDNSFYHFLQSLSDDLTQIRNFTRFGKLYEIYCQLDTFTDSNLLRAQLRLLSSFSPLPNKGKNIKTKFLKQFIKLLNYGVDNNIKALKNINWSSFENGQEQIEEVISSYINKKLNSSNQDDITILSELINISIEEDNKNWWHKIITESVNICFQKQEKGIIATVWRLIDNSGKTLKNLLPLLSSISKCETILLSAMPNKLEEATLDLLFLVALENNWYLLYSHLLIKRYTVQESISRQLMAEKMLDLAHSIGLLYLTQQLSDIQLLELTLSNNEEKLIDLTVAKIEIDKLLMSGFDPKKEIWLTIWSKLTHKKKDAFYGIQGKEKETIFVVLDKIYNNAFNDWGILGLLSISSFADISEYTNRKEIWQKLPSQNKDQFIFATAPALLNQFIDGTIERNSIEEQISSRIVSDDFMTSLLKKYRDNIEPVIKVYENFDNLKDNFLADYIRHYPTNISENQSVRLGKLVTNKHYKATAKIIFEKAKYLYSFKFANNECASLLENSLVDSLLSIFGGSKGKTKYYKNIMETDAKHNTILNLPTVVILTAIKEEYQAVREHLICVVDADKNDTAYEAGIFKYNDKEIAKIIIRECGPRNTTASQETERAIQYFMPDAMFFVGIAGSRKPNDFSIGDVIFPEKVYSYESGKSEEHSFVARPDIGSITYALIEKAKKERHKNEWKQLIKGDWNVDSLKADLGVIASGEQVVEHYDSNVGIILKKHFNDTSAVEMEGFGFAKAANRQGRNTRNMEIGIVRGISDIIEQPSKQIKDDIYDRRPINAKQIASASAAAFTYWLILKTYS